ncbi:uncharacterized protein LOC132059060 [Lycium ferocissimum]|uniref:uncharacterized protein LOC132059060 n=1 Tax=Lycium ferocissimum TaxID=112874 RepID=UPI002814E039|nr:uncharacterized protein LOC132059060 [Lycium ferocissimum]
MSIRTTTFWTRILRFRAPPPSTTAAAAAPLFRQPPPPHSTVRFFSSSFYNNRKPSADRVIQELLFEVERDKQREKEERKKKGLDTTDIDAEENEDSMGVGPLIEKIEKKKVKDDKFSYFDEPTDSDSEDDDERWTPDAVNKRWEVFDKKFKRHEELLVNFTDAGTLLRH